MSSVERRGWEKGYEVGRREGIMEHLTELLERRFLDVLSEDRMRLAALTSEQLVELIGVAVDVSTYREWREHLDQVSPPRGKPESPS